MLKNLPRQYNPPGNGKRDMEKPIFADRAEIAMIKALFGPGEMTKHGIPSYSWRDTTSATGTQDGSGGSMNASGNVSGTGGGGFGGNAVTGSTGGRGGYTFSGVPGTRNIGNWNTGGPAVGVGSQAGGINPLGPPPQRPGISPAMSQPVRPVRPPPVPPQLPIQYPQPGTVTDVFGPTYPMDPGIINQMFQGMPPAPDPLAGFRNPGGNYPAQYNGGGSGQSFNNGFGSVGAGRGGGGGGGW